MPNGWKTIYHDRELAAGIAPDDVEPFLGQRLRWAQGAMEILRKDNPLKRKGLSASQRISYFTSTVYVFEYLPKVIYLAMPPIALVSGALPMTNMGWNLILRFAPYYILGMLATQRLAHGSNPILRSEGFFLLKMEVMLRAMTMLVWPRELKFKVTSKSASGDGHRLFVLWQIRTQVTLGALCAIAALWGAASWAFGAPWALSGMSLLVTIAWASANAGLVALLIRSVLNRHHRREVYRFEVTIPVVVTTARRKNSAKTVDVSTRGFGWNSGPWYAVGQQVEVELHPPSADAIQARAAVTSCIKVDGHFRVGAEFREMTPQTEKQLVMALFHEVAPGQLSIPSITATPTGRAA